MTLEDLTPAALTALALVLPLSIAATNVFLAALSALALAGLLKKPSAWKSEWNPALWALAAYGVAGLAVAAAGVAPLRSLREAAKDWHRAWALSAVLLTLAAAPRLRVERALAAGFGVSALYGLWQSATEHAGGIWMRAHARLHPVTYGDMMAAAVLGGLCFWARAEAGLDSPSVKRWTGAFLALALSALVLNQTRGALLGLGAGFAAVCWLDARLRRWALPAAGTAGGMLAVWELLPTGGRSLISVLRFQLHQGQGFNPLLARWELWSVAWRMFKDHPLLGVGPGNYNTEFAKYFQGSLDNQAVWGSAHNLYLQQLAERGLVGLTVLLVVLGVFVRGAYARARREPSAWNLWAWGAWIAFLVMNLTETAFQTELAATFFIFLWACAQTRSPA